ncbi:thioesterase domain-containing protein [Streptomyces sp. NPDC048191]|uniref:thioesterase II family protein n=1 Tax=Streptomyces sp. NPDC048191 TaxID=3155484 RepID=UPI00340B3D9A
MREWEDLRPGPGPTAPWTPYLTIRPAPSDGRPRLFCFHHAGGSASAFTVLRNTVAAHVEVLPVQLPGRENRLRDTRPGSMAELVADLDEHLDPHLTGPYAFYGHSMGALVAHDLIARRQARGALPPVRFIAGAARAPHLSPAFAAAWAEADDELVQKIIAIGGMSPDLLQYPDWLRPALDLTRADLRLCTTRGSAPVPELSCPVDVFHGAADPLVSEADALAWTGRSSVDSTLHRFDGGHFFFLKESPAPFAARLTTLLHRVRDLVREH